MARTGTPFSGLAGAMFSRTVSPGAFFTGFIYLAAIGALAEFAPNIGSQAIAAAAAQLITAFFLAHFAVEGYSDQWERAGRTIPPAEVGAVALRYLLLATLVLMPVFAALEWRETAFPLVLESEWRVMLAVMYVLALMASPPALLVIAVSATSSSEVLSPAHWGSRFHGRWMDFLLIYAIFAGAIFCLVLAGVPLIVYARTYGPDTMQTVGEGLALFAIGFGISLVGRLCGSFAVLPAPEAADTKPAPLHPSLVQFKGAAPAPSATVSAAPAPADAAAPRKAALLDAGARVEQLRATHASDPAALVDALRELDDTFLPHPSVRQGLVLALVAAGRQQEAVDAAREAIPMCMKTGNVVAAALIFEALLSAGEMFGLAKEQIAALGDALRSVKRHASAANVYGVVLNAAPGDIKAMKGMIAVAQTFAQQQESANAVRIYDYVIAHCAGSPLLDFVNTERAKLERKVV
jgi:hypothetical protein